MQVLHAGRVYMHAAWTPILYAGVCVWTLVNMTLESRILHTVHVLYVALRDR